MKSAPRQLSFFCVDDMLTWWQSSSCGTDQDGKPGSCVLHAN
jgi:hypothetical protein